MYKGNKFKNVMGAHLLQALFFETAIDTDRPDCLYTLKQEAHEEPTVRDGETSPRRYPSIHQLYVSLSDASEYQFALSYFDNLAHWKKLCACNWFKPYLDAMREELDLKLRAEALNNLKDIAADKSNKSNYLANKFIIENGLAPKKDERGRPSAQKIQQAAQAIFKDSVEVSEDYERINLN